jgi:hypothetical protein
LLLSYLSARLAPQQQVEGVTSVNLFALNDYKLDHSGSAGI